MKFLAGQEKVLCDITGPKIARIIALQYKWTLGGILSFSSFVPLAGFVNPVGSHIGILLGLPFMGLGVFCARKSMRLGKISAVLASNYFTEKLGREVHITDPRPTVNWWRWRLTQETETVGSVVKREN